MASQLETTGTLERRLTLSVNPADISSKVQERLRSMAKTTRMPGFRPGKVPVRLIEQSYGPQVHSEVLGDAISRAFSDAVQAENLRVAGQPEIAPKDESQGPDATEFVATFEVYPDVKLGDPATLEVDRYNASVDDKALEATIDVLRKQRTRWNAVDRAGEKGDRATIDFVGKLDGEAFPGGSAEGFPMVLGEGRMLPDFEAGVLGKKAGETVTFDVKFPDDYNAEHLAGKTAQFEVKIQKIEAPELPEVDAEFARQMGQEDGDVEKFRADVRTNLEREVRQRVQSRTKSSVMDKIVGLADIELPTALVGCPHARGPAGPRRGPAQGPAGSHRCLHRTGHPPRASGPDRLRSGARERPAGQARADPQADRGIRLHLREPGRGDPLVLQRP